MYGLNNLRLSGASGTDSQPAKGSQKSRRCRNQSMIFAPAIRSMNSRFEWNLANFEVNCSMASTGCIVASVRRNMVTARSVSAGKSFSSRRVPDCEMSIAGQTRRSANLRSSTNSMLPVPLNSWKINSSMRLPVSIRAVPTMVNEPPSSNNRAVANSFFGMSMALISTPPLIVRPVLPTHLLNARASRVMESSRRTTSLTHLGQALAAFDDELRETHMAFDITIEAAGDHFAIDGAAHVRDFLRPFVDQQHDQLDAGEVRCNAMADVLQQNRLTGPWRSDDQRTLTFAQRREQVHNPGRHWLRAGLQTEPGLGIDRRELIKRLDVLIFLGRHAVHVDDFAKPRALLPTARLNHAVDDDAFAKAELLDHAAGHERVGELAHVIFFGIAEKPIAVGVHFKHTTAGLQGSDLAILRR